MTVTLRGLLVENEKKNADLVCNHLDLEFLAFSWSVRWSVCQSAIEARKLIQAGEDFDFAIIDYHLGEGEPTGLTVLQHLRGANKSSYILVISSLPDENPDFIPRSRHEGADQAVFRRQLTFDPAHEWSFRSLAERIRRHLLARNRIPGLQIAFIEDDLGIQSMLHAIGSPAPEGEDPVARGRGIVRTLAMACLEPSHHPEETTFEFRYLAPGRSGAYICRVDRSRQRAATESYVLKLGLDAHALRHEKAANERAVQALPVGTLIQVSDVSTDDQVGYAAITARLADQASTLGVWLQGRAGTWPTRHQACELAEGLFGSQLTKLFEPSLHSPQPIERWLRISPMLELRVRQALDTYAGIWSHPDGGGQADADRLAAVIRGFLDRRTPHGIEPARLSGDVVFVRGFGDLHSSNVLVQQHVPARLVLVDASLYGSQHWAGDAARLLVNLVIRVRTAGTHMMLWKGLTERIGFASALCPSAQREPLDDATTPLDAFAGHILTGLKRFLHIEDVCKPSATWHWQWHMALAKEFLRQGTHPDLMPTQAVLALTAAAHHLDQAGRQFRAIDSVETDATADRAGCGVR